MIIKNKKKIAIIATVPMMIRFFLVNHINLLKNDYEVTIITNLNINRELINVFSNDIKKIHIPFRRNISLFYDIFSLILLMFHFKRNKYKITYSISPKGGFLSTTAAYIMRIPVRIHTFTGQVWVNNKGLKKYILQSIDKLISFFATKVIIDSQSQKSFLIDKKIINQDKSIVIGDGSISGVNIKKFKPNFDTRKKIRLELGVNEKAIVYLFLGRINKDKGILTLIEAYKKILKDNMCDDSCLWIVGKDEESLLPKLKSELKVFSSKVRFVDYTDHPEKYMQSADIFCLPSKREGFGSTIIESGACGIPSIASNIYGIVDAVSKDTGLLCELDSADDLAKKMVLLARNKDLREEMGKKAKERTIDKFEENNVSFNLINLINSL